MKTKLTADDMYTAATTLKKSERGRQAMGGLKALFDSASGLDSTNGKGAHVRQIKTA